MSGWHDLYYKLVNLPLNLLVKSKVIPNDPIAELGLDISRPIVYALPYDSKADLLALRTQCQQLDLPDPLTSIEIDGCILPRYVFIHDGPRFFPSFEPNTQTKNIFHSYLDLHRNNQDLDIQLLPVSVMFGRAPAKEVPGESRPLLRELNGIQKFFAILWLGRDSFVRFSPVVSLRQMADQHGTDQSIAHKLSRVAHIHFARQRLAAVGPNLPARQDLFDKLLKSRAIAKAVEDESRSKKISLTQAQANAVTIMEEIAANFSYEAIRITDRIMGWLWSRLYKGINVSGGEKIRQLAQDGHELVYLPCHRSHMDYLLLSYVLYYQGLVPPHIAAGVNLNFWPAGPIFRHLGAFFIRRSFKGNKLYSTVFREYLGELFSRGYSVEYFVEGGRSRTGRLLEPKTGTLTMTIQAMLRGTNRPITLIPIYIGYEHVIEVSTYSRELQGATKEKENLLQMLRGLRKLRNLGQGYVNFGEPLSLVNYLNQHVTDWRDAIDPIEAQRPAWMAQVVSDIAEKMMVRINNAGAANAMNLCVTALLSSSQRSLTRKQLLTQLDCYCALLKNVPYSEECTVPSTTPEQLLDSAMAMNKFAVEHDTLGEMISLPREQAVLMTYYRNNIHHLLVMPSLVAAVISHHTSVARTEINHQIALIYPMLRNELFLRWTEQELAQVIDQILAELNKQQLIIQQQQTFRVNPARHRTCLLLASGVRETLQRFALTFTILCNKPDINRGTLEKESRTLAQRLSTLHGINAPEFFDKAVFSSLVNTLRQKGYISDKKQADTKQTAEMRDMLLALVSDDVRLTILNADEMSRSC